MEYLLSEILLFLSIHILCIYPYIFCICLFLSLLHARVYARARIPYIIYTRVRTDPTSPPKTDFPHFGTQNPHFY